MTLQPIAFIVGAMLTQCAIAFYQQVTHRKEQAAHAETLAKLSEAQQRLMLSGQTAGQLTRERDHLREVLRHCTCASSPAPASRAETRVK